MREGTSRNEFNKAIVIGIIQKEAGKQNTELILNFLLLAL